MNDQAFVRLLYRDAMMLVIDKPAGIPVHRGPKGGANLEDYFQALRSRIWDSRIRFNLIQASCWAVEASMDGQMRRKGLSRRRAAAHFGVGYSVAIGWLKRFRLYVEKVLVPALQPGDIVVMDNLGSHKSKAVRKAFRAAGVRLFLLPKYSPDLNPIEQFFAKLKHWLRKAAKRTTEGILEGTGSILDDVTPSECRNYFSNSGYDLT